VSEERGAVRAVLLDVDGTLIDSNDAHARAWVDAGREFGRDIEFGEVRRMIGMGGDKVLPRLTGLEEESDEGARLLERRGEIFRERYLSQLQPLPGAVDLVKRLRSDGMTLVVATSASEEDLGPLLKQAGLDGLLQQATNSDDADDERGPVTRRHDRGHAVRRGGGAPRRRPRHRRRMRRLDRRRAEGRA
jgi:phosphoglycolate phosphatase-like HAD superfamily hydrolase